MRLLLVIDSLGSGGAQRQMVNLALGLQQRGHQVEFFVYHPQYDHFADAVHQASIPIHSYRKRWRYSPGVIWALRHLMQIGNYQAVVSFLDTPNFYAEIAHVGLRIPLVVSERFMYTTESLTLSQWILQETHHLADYIVVNSYHQRERMERLFPWMRGKICTIYNGVDLNSFFPPTRRESKGLRLLVLGSIVPKKNVIGLINALAKYRERYGKTCLMRWAGKVNRDRVSQKTFEDAQSLVQELGLTDSWEWLGERKDVPDLLRDCDALIHPAFYEGLPNAICEALACGRPVLASNVCDHPRLVQEGITGFLFDPADPYSIAEAMGKFAQLGWQEKREMGKRARDFAEKTLSLERYVEQYESLLQNLVLKTVQV